MLRTLTFLTIFSFVLLQNNWAQNIPITFQSDNLTLNGTLTIPTGQGPFPAVILVHGSGPSDRDQTVTLSDGNSMCLYPQLFGKTIKNFKDIAEYLGNQGIAVLRYDKRTFTHGASLDEKTISTYDFANDIEAAIDFLKTRSEVNAECIVLAGHSQGSVLIPVAAMGRNDVAGLISLAGTVTPIDSILPEQFRDIYIQCANAPALGELVASQFYNQFQQKRQGTFPLDQQVEINVPGNPSNPVPFGYGLFWRDWIEMNDAVIDNYTSIGVPILIMQGENDFNVPPDNADKFEAGLPATRTTVLKYPGINHFLTTQNDPKVDSQLLADMADWIKNTKTSSVKNIATEKAATVVVKDSSILVNFDTANHGFTRFEMLDVNGKTISKGPIDRASAVEININLTPGQYFLSLTGKKHLTQPFVVVR
ncbi:MAG: alpha/beta fold hydrolase [Saprospiraceae bacterium]|nr:alpha/beta fold hydrolase [Saprospiraceae bacterium]